MLRGGLGTGHHGVEAVWEGEEEVGVMARVALAAVKGREWRR